MLAAGSRGGSGTSTPTGGAGVYGRQPSGSILAQYGRPESPGARAPPIVDIAELERKRKSGLKGMFSSGKSEKLEIIEQQQAYIQDMTRQLEALQREKAELARTAAEGNNAAIQRAQAAAATEWQHKWNFQNFKVNLLIDMLVLQMLDARQAPAAAAPQQQMQQQQAYDGGSGSMAVQEFDD